ncbi:hypothetical protein SMC26_08650 [Actinomadura fulvescens]|uniref:Uncharacterized protein n=1 Tax=Actinomadura fulvescens TaxID=46160 RepID=A0ABP6DA34_9ACTN
MNDLRDELHSLADHAAPADLLDRAYATSRRIKRRRQALATGVAGGLAAAVLLGFASFGGTTSTDDKADPMVTPTASATTPVLPNMKPFVPPATHGGGRTTVPVVLQDGTEVRFSYPSGLGLRFSKMETGFNGTDLNVGLNAATVIKTGSRYVRNVTDASGQQLELWREPKEPGSESDVEVYSVRVGNWFVTLDEVVSETDPDPSFPELRRVTFFIDPRGVLRVSGDPVAKVKPGSANDSGERGPVAELAVQGSESKTLFIRRVSDCIGADRDREGELSSLMVCKDGAAVHVAGRESDEDWIKQVKSGLRIESVKTP